MLILQNTVSAKADFGVKAIKITLTNIQWER